MYAYKDWLVTQTLNNSHSDCGLITLPRMVSHCMSQSLAGVWPIGSSSMIT